MKLVITKLISQAKKIEDLTGNEIVVYRQRSADPKTRGYCILYKLMTGQYGFLPVHTVNCSAAFVSDTWLGSIEKAGEVRDIHVFEDEADL